MSKSESLEFFLNEENVLAAIDHPDNAIDHAFMLSPLDWKLLSAEWDQRSTDWESGLAYFAGFAPLSYSGSILFKALKNEDEEIVLQALFSIYECIAVAGEGEEENYVFQEGEKELVVAELNKRSSEFDDYPELEELMGLLKK